MEAVYDQNLLLNADQKSDYQLFLKSNNHWFYFIAKQ